MSSWPFVGVPIFVPMPPMFDAYATDIITAAYHLWAMQRMFLGKFKEDWRSSHYLEAFGGKFPEINGREIASLVPLAVIVLVLGFYPKPLLTLIDRGVIDLFNVVSPPGPTQIAALGGK